MSKLPSNLTTPFQASIIGKVVTGQSGILPFTKRNRVDLPIVVPSKNIDTRTNQ